MRVTDLGSFRHDRDVCEQRKAQTRAYCVAIDGRYHRDVALEGMHPAFPGAFHRQPVYPLRVRAQVHHGARLHPHRINVTAGAEPVPFSPQDYGTYILIRSFECAPVEHRQPEELRELRAYTITCIPP